MLMQRSRYSIEDSCGLFERLYSNLLTTPSHVSACTGQRGFWAETFLITQVPLQSPQPIPPSQYFMKIIPPHFPDKSQLISSFSILKVLRECECLAEVLPEVVRNGEGRLHAVLEDGSVVVLFGYVEGRCEATDEYAMGEWYGTMRRIHGATEGVRLKCEELRVVIAKEDFNCDGSTILVKLKELESGDGKDELIGRMKDMLNQERGFLVWLVEHFVKLQVKLKENYLELEKGFVLTHGDALGLNVIRKKDGKLCIIDWDGAKLAPQERDFWFYLKHEREQDSEMIPIKTEFTSLVYDVNWEFYEYYLLVRFLEDVVEFMNEILDCSNEIEHREECLKGIQKDCFEWTGALVKNIYNQ